MLSGSYQLPNNENNSRSVSSSTRGISVTLITGIKTGQCPKCNIEHNELGSADTPAALRDLTAVLNVLALINEDYIAFNHACRDLGIKPIYKPF